MPRLFTGIELPPDIAAMLAGLRGGLPGARWAEPADYHLTLRFIGDVDRHAARDVEMELAETRAAPVTVTLTGLDSFGGAKPHSVFAAVSPNRALMELQAEHERAVRRAGLPPEKRKYVPHVTLARLRSAAVLDVADYLQSRGGFRSITFQPERFVLFSARDLVGGGPYIVEAAYPLQ
jgi:2'-5' RNA ligase